MTVQKISQRHSKLYTVHESISFESKSYSTHFSFVIKLHSAQKKHKHFQYLFIRSRTTQHYRHRASPDCNTVASYDSSSSESRNGLNRYYRQAWENLHESASKNSNNALRRKETFDTVNLSRSRDNLARSRDNLDR